MSPTPRRRFDLNQASPRTIDFEYLEDLDVVVATPIWELENEADVQEWYRQYHDYFSESFDGPVDVIFDLSFFHVGFPAAAAFGEARVKVISEFTRRSYRCHHVDAFMTTVMYTSAIKHNTEANEFPTFESAVQALLADRAAESATATATATG